MKKTENIEIVNFGLPEANEENGDELKMMRAHAAWVVNLGGRKKDQNEKKKMFHCLCPNATNYVKIY